VYEIEPSYVRKIKIKIVTLLIAITIYHGQLGKDVIIN
jgi:hypothetical protein